jgi:sugar phosphate isomerase/epimerase
MAPKDFVSSRSFLALSSTLPLVVTVGCGKRVPVGLELYSVREDLKKDLPGTVAAVAKMGYQVVEFYAPYYDWTPEYAKGVRKQMDDLGIRCNSTHNSATTLTAAGLPKAIELNQILGVKYIVMASAGKIETLDGWKAVADQLTQAADTLRPVGMRTGYHNHQLEFRAVDGKFPLEVIAAGTPKDVMLQLDVGTCIEAGYDPVTWIEAHPGRINSIHCKDWQRGRGYDVLFGEGDAPWAKIFTAAETVGGVEFYLIEQEGSKFPELETVQRCLANWKKFRG